VLASRPGRPIEAGGRWMPGGSGSPEAGLRFVVALAGNPVTMPIGVVPGQPGALQAQDDPGLARAHVGDQPLESFPVGGRSAGVALAGVNDDDLLAAPAERDRAPAQVVVKAHRPAR